MNVELISAERLFDGFRISRAGQAVALAGGLIDSVGPVQTLRSRYPEAPVCEYGDATILPGFIDSHVHLTMPGDGSAYEVGASKPRSERFAVAERNLREHLECGVTTVRDLGSHRDFLDWAPSDLEAVPRLLRYGPPITGVRGHMHMFGGEVASGIDAKSVAEDNMRHGADGLKFVASGGGTAGTVPWNASLDDEVMAAGMSVAHRHGKLATTHALSVVSIDRALRAGTDGIEHLGFLDEKGHSAPTVALVDRAIERNIVFGSTLGCNERYVALARSGSVSAEEMEEQLERTEYYVSNAGLLRRLGATVAAGSDAGWKFTRFGDFANELRLLVAAGFTLSQVLNLATAGNADCLRVGDWLGRLWSGYSADLIVLGGDAVADMTALTDVRAVYRAGKRVVVHSK